MTPEDTEDAFAFTTFTPAATATVERSGRWVSTEDGNPSRGEFKSPEQAKRVLNKRAEKFAKAIDDDDAEIAAIDAERLKNASDAE